MIISLADKVAKALGGMVEPGGPTGAISFIGRLLDDGDRSTPRIGANSTLKALLRQELIRQTGMRIPAIYANLASRVGLTGADALDLVRSLLEGFMEDDVDHGRPLLAAVAVSSFKTGLPSPWFFRKAARIGRTSCGVTDLAAYAFHAKELHHALCFYAGSQASLTAKSDGQHTVVEKGNKMLIAKDIMTPSTVSVGLDSTVTDVVDVLISRGISGVPVLDNGVLCGIVSEGDLLHRMEIGTDAQPRPWWRRLLEGNASVAADYIKSHSVHIADVMTRDVVTVVETTPVVEIIDLLERNRIRRVPVVRDGQVVGMVSRMDLVKAILVAGRSIDPANEHDDSRIYVEIMDALRAESWLSKESSRVTVKNGIVAFWGVYTSEEERKAMHILAENIAGVHAVDDHRTLMTIPYGIM